MSYINPTRCAVSLVSFEMPHTAYLSSSRLLSCTSRLPTHNRVFRPSHESASVCAVLQPLPATALITVLPFRSHFSQLVHSETTAPPVFSPFTNVPQVNPRCCVYLHCFTLLTGCTTVLTMHTTLIAQLTTLSRSSSRLTRTMQCFPVTHWAYTIHAALTRNT